jgi:hypothetical protein
VKLNQIAIAALLLFISAFVTGCGYQGWVRYPCQEYENWQKAECQPPQCEAVGQCTKDLLPEVEIQNG